MITRRDCLTLGAGLFLGGMGGSYLNAKYAPKPKGCKLSGTPLDELHTYLCAFHVQRDNIKNQVEAHHYCMPLRDGVFQCVVLDSNKAKAKIIGVEYIVSNEIFQSLSEEEKKYWHPHEYEVASGLLVVPGMTKEEEKQFLQMARTTFGKVIQTWPDINNSLPLGAPVMMDAFRKDDEIDPELISKRDKQLNIDTNKIRKERADW